MPGTMNEGVAIPGFGEDALAARSISWQGTPGRTASNAAWLAASTAS